MKPSIIMQYLVEALLLTALAVPTLERRDTCKLLLVIESLNVLRFGGALGALTVLATAPVPWFIAQVAIGDAVAATSATVALVMLVRRSRHTIKAVFVANAIGLFGIVVSETCLQWLETTGRIARPTTLHGPTIGSAIFTALHLLAFTVVRKRAVPARA